MDKGIRISSDLTQVFHGRDEGGILVRRDLPVFTHVRLQFFF